MGMMCGVGNVSVSTYLYRVEAVCVLNQAKVFEDQVNVRVSACIFCGLQCYPLLL